MEQLYTYAVARIRSKELSLLNAQALEQLMAAKSYDECLQLLADRGWGDGTRVDAETLLRTEQEKTWSMMEEFVEDMSVFDVFLYANDYHNLKAAVKLVFTDTEAPDLFIAHGTVDPQVIYKAVKDRDYGLLPERMRPVAEDAFETLLHTRDGQLCDIIIDRAALDAIARAGGQAENGLIRSYAELTVAAADIKTAVRAQKTGKPLDLIRRALAPCKTLDVDRLAQAAVQGGEAIYEYLSHTDYAEAAAELRESPSAFERWCDDLIIRRIRPQMYNPFTIGPLAAYILARENEIKTVRIILSGKLNALPEESVRVRLREMYAN